MTETKLTPAQFQQELCKRLIARAHAQGLNVTQGKGVKLTRTYMENLAGVGYAAELLESEHLRSLLGLMTLVAARGAEVVHNIAEGKPI